MKLVLRLPTLEQTFTITVNVVFWTFNVLLVSLVYFGLIPLELGAVLDGVDRGFFSRGQVLILVSLALVPVASVALAYLRLRRRPDHLLAYFFAVEAPSLLWLTFHFFFRRTLQLSVHVLVLAFTLGALGHVLTRARRRPWLGQKRALAQLALHTLGLCAGLYLAGLLAFFVPVWVHGMIELADSSDLWRPFWRALHEPRPLEVLGFVLATFGGGLVLGVPLGVVFGPLQLVKASLRRFRPTPAWRTACGVAAGTAAAFVAVFLAGFAQPQRRAFEATDAPPRTDAARDAWLEDAGPIAAGLENAYLQRSRYFDRDRSANLLVHGYAPMLPNLSAREAIQAAFDAYARPFVYADAGRQMVPQQAADRYARYFDADIEDAVGDERARAGQVGRFRLGGFARRTDIDREAVHLDAQSVTVTPHGPWAEVEIHEVYRNRTGVDQETRITFELPPSAALTGLWLGPDADRNHAFAFVVAPRGAARRTYVAQVERRVDPALLEQIGPRHYRLRAFPIPARPAHGPAPDVHLWMTYQVLSEAEGWPAPRLLERRNLFFDDTTERRIDGQPTLVAGWLPNHFDGASDATPWQVSLGDGSWLGGARIDPAASRRIEGRVLVVVDRSYSMRKVPAALRRALEAIAHRTRSPLALLTSAPDRGAPARRILLSDVHDEDLTPFGGHAIDLLFRQAAPYLEACDAVVVLTDDSDAPLGALPVPVSRRRPPIFVWHLGGTAPSLDDRLTHAVYGSGGDVLPFGPEALDALAVATSTRPDVVGVAGRWRIRRGRGPTPEGAEGPRGLAAAWHVRAEARGSLPPNLDALDRLHEIARTTPVITPWSSMIVLVNEAQRAQLADATRSNARFSRSEPPESTPPPGGTGLSVSGAPEPATWVLIGLTGAANLVARRRRRGRIGPRLR